METCREWGGVFNLVNLHVYHYAGNNPVVFRDPDGRTSEDAEHFWNIWDPILKSDLTAFLGNKNAQQRHAGKVNYHVQEFDKMAVAALEKTSKVTSKATIFFLQ
jgi:hypothetical protein